MSCLEFERRCLKVCPHYQMQCPGTNKVLSKRNLYHSSYPVHRACIAQELPLCQSGDSFAASDQPESTVGAPTSLSDDPDVQKHTREAPHLPALLWGAHRLVSCYAQHVGHLQGIDIERGVALHRVEAAAEATVRAQKDALAAVFKHVERMCSIGQWQAVAFLHWNAYDETALDICTKYQGGEGKEREIAKVWIFEQSWAMLCRKRACNDDASPPSVRDYFVLEATLSPALRVSASNTGETLLQLFHTLTPLPPSLPDQFGAVVRLVESDESGANGRGECLLWRERGGEETKWMLMRLCCLAHKLHRCASLQWGLMGPFISGLIHCSKLLSFAGSMSTLKRKVSEMVDARFTVLHQTAPSEESEELRRLLRTWFLPYVPGQKAQTVFALCLEFFNGTWSSPCVLEHRCTGVGCCRSAAFAAEKAKAILSRFLSHHKPVIFSRSNWVEWPRCLGFYAIMSTMHGFGADCIRRAFPVAAAAQDADIHDAWASDGGNVDAGPGAQEREGLDPEVEAMAAVRAEKLRSLKTATALMRPGLFEDVLLLKVTLHPEHMMMQELLGQTSRAWEMAQLGQEIRGQARQLRVVDMQAGRHTSLFLQSTWRNFRDRLLWKRFPQTESFRSKLLRLTMRPAATFHQLLVQRLRHCPYLLFSILGARDDRERHAIASACLQTPFCLRDEFSLRFMQKYDSEESLVSLEARQILQLMAKKIQLTTYSSERGHSRNLRRAKSKPMTHRPQVSQLALAHSGCAAPITYSPGEEQACSKKRGRPAQTLLEKPGPKKPGGSWRAFLHCNLGGQRMTAKNVSSLAQSYQTLSEAERQRYNQIGLAGWRASH